MQIVALSLSVLIIAICVFGALLLRKQTAVWEYLIRLDTQFSGVGSTLRDSENTLRQLNDDISIKQSGIKDWITQHLTHNLARQQESLQKSMQDIRQQITLTLISNSDNLTKTVDKLTHATEQKLKEISQHVEKRLTDGFEKTTATFTDVIRRLAIIDEAQKKITELSSNVVSLQEILADKRSRGAFGEVQLSALIRNMMPENAFSFQHTLSNGKRPDCILFLPEPSGNVVIDAKFPLESYQKLSNISLAESERRTAEQQFRQDIRKHIQDIATKYITPSETADGAMMFIPAEAVFAEIHGHYPDLVEEAQKARVWLVSPTTMMAILTTARAVLKDAATRKQIHVIQEHLSYLAKDFERFQQRMGNLARHIDQANQDVKDVKISAEKITSRFGKIEKVELHQEGISEEVFETLGQE